MTEKQISTPKKKERIYVESIVKDMLIQSKHGVAEVKTPVGIIDVVSYLYLTIYEIKHVSKWKHALGQILSYGYFYPDYKKAIYLFGNIDERSAEIITKICNNSSVTSIFLFGSMGSRGVITDEHRKRLNESIVESAKYRAEEKASRKSDETKKNFLFHFINSIGDDIGNTKPALSVIRGEAA